MTEAELEKQDLLGDPALKREFNALKAKERARLKARKEKSP